MISPKLKTLFLLLSLVFIAHGFEELLTGFYNIDSHVAFVFGFVQAWTPIHAAFFVFQIMMWLLFIISFFLILGPKWQLRLLVIPGLVIIYEFHHFYKAIEIGVYYPGFFTALLFPILGYWYWKEWMKMIGFISP